MGKKVLLNVLAKLLQTAIIAALHCSSDTLCVLSGWDEDRSAAIPSALYGGIGAPRNIPIISLELAAMRPSSPTGGQHGHKITQHVLRWSSHCNYKMRPQASINHWKISDQKIRKEQRQVYCWIEQVYLWHHLRWPHHLHCCRLKITKKKIHGLSLQKYGHCCSDISLKNDYKCLPIAVFAKFLRTRMYTNMTNHLQEKQTQMMLHCCERTKCLKLHLSKDWNEPSTQTGGEFTASFVCSILMAESWLQGCMGFTEPFSTPVSNKSQKN